MNHLDDSFSARRYMFWDVGTEREHGGHLVTPHGIAHISRYRNKNQGDTWIDFVYNGRLWRRWFDGWLTKLQCSRQAWKFVNEIISQEKTC